MSEAIIRTEQICRRIMVRRGQKGLLDRDLAELYGVETRVLNQAGKRNLERFPEDFMFALSRDEIVRMSQIVTSSGGLKFFRRVHAFTEQEPPKKTRREIGFHVRETSPRYGRHPRR